MLEQILGFVSDIIKPVTGMIDNLTTTNEEKLKLKNEMERIQNSMAAKYVELEAKAIDAKKEIMVAELQQSDKYTKRARPTIIYAGLGILLLNNVILPWASVFITQTLPNITLPTEFWVAWGGVAGVYAFRRSTEKMKGAN